MPRCAVRRKPTIRKPTIRANAPVLARGNAPVPTAAALGGSMAVQKATGKRHAPSIGDAVGMKRAKKKIKKKKAKRRPITHHLAVMNAVLTSLHVQPPRRVVVQCSVACPAASSGGGDDDEEDAETSLRLAIANDDPTALRKAIQRGADYNSEDYLLQCIEENKVECFDILFAQPNIDTFGMETYFHDCLMDHEYDHDEFNSPEEALEDFVDHYTGPDAISHFWYAYKELNK